MTTVNNYQAGYFNGDMGVITSISDLGTMTIQIKEKNIIMQPAWLEDIIPAYCVTIHKSQGSEFDTVFVILPQNPNILLERSLLYTAITRAKKKVVIFSQGNALEQAIGRTKKGTKKTGLQEKLRAI